MKQINLGKMKINALNYLKIHVKKRKNWRWNIHFKSGERGKKK